MSTTQPPKSAGARAFATDHPPQRLISRTGTALGQGLVTWSHWLFDRGIASIDHEPYTRNAQEYLEEYNP